MADGIPPRPPHPVAAEQSRLNQAQAGEFGGLVSCAGNAATISSQGLQDLLGSLGPEKRAGVCVPLLAQDTSAAARVLGSGHAELAAATSKPDRLAVEPYSGSTVGFQKQSLIR